MIDYYNFFLLTIFLCSSIEGCLTVNIVVINIGNTEVTINLSDLKWDIGNIAEVRLVSTSSPHVIGYVLK